MKTYREKDHPLCSLAWIQSVGIDIGKSAHHGEEISPSQFRSESLRVREMESPNGSAFFDHRDDLFVSRTRSAGYSRTTLSTGKDTSFHGQSFKADVRKYPPAAKHRGIRARFSSFQISAWFAIVAAAGARVRAELNHRDPRSLREI